MSFITIKIEIPADLARIHIKRDVPLVVTVWPEQMGEAAADPTGRFSDTDVLIAGLLDADGPLTAGQIRARLDADHGHSISDDSSIRRRFGKGMPLADAGYRSTPRGYASPRA